jgi:prepilin-type N-terminal cleavage/methylation domain-containing protein
MRVIKYNAFSLIELLVALSILSVVAAIIVPKYINLRAQANAAALQETVDQLNRTLSSWIDLGGIMGTNVYASDVLRVLASTSPQDFDEGSGRSMKDSAQSVSMRSTIPQEIVQQLVGNPQLTTVSLNGNLIYYDQSQKQFGGVPIAGYRPLSPITQSNVPASPGSIFSISSNGNTVTIISPSTSSSGNRWIQTASGDWYNVILELVSTDPVTGVKTYNFTLQGYAK